MTGAMDVVIPVWNEEAWLDRLLTRLRRSPLIDTIFVVDNNSTDRSRDIARSHGCVVLMGGRPARARNIGAVAARSDLLLFVDADTIVPDATMKDVLRTFLDPAVAAVHFRNFPLTRSLTIRLSYLAMHYYLIVIAYFGVSQGIGTAIAVRAGVVQALDGFREDIAVGEDADFLRRAADLGKVLYLSNSAVFTSPRRMVVEGQFVFSCKVMLWTMLRLLKLRVSILDYCWQPYQLELVTPEDAVILELNL